MLHDLWNSRGWAFLHSTMIFLAILLYFQLRPFLSDRVGHRDESTARYRVAVYQRW